MEIGLKLDEIERAYMAMTPRSKELFEESMKITPAGVHHASMIKPWPIERGVVPPFIHEAKGQYMWDADGNKYCDYFNHGVLFLGHAHPAVVKAIQEQAARGGAMMGDHTDLQIRHVKKIISMVPCAEEVRFCNSGTEATMYAIRIARAYTKREKVGKFAGDFHGANDQLYVAVGAPYDKPQSGGIPSDCYKNTIVLTENDVEGLEKAVKQHDFAAIICEFIHGSGEAGMQMDLDFLKALREITEENGVVLIADEVISGFRMAPGGAQEYLGVTPDLTAMGKMIGGGIGGSGGFCGKSEVMEIVNTKVPGRERWEAAITCGTFSGNAISMAAGYAALDTIDEAKGELNRYANRLGDRAREELNEFFEAQKIKAQAIGTGSLVNVQFTEKPIQYVQDLAATDKKAQYRYHLWMATQGIFTLPGCNFYISAVHTEEDIDFLTEKTKEYLKKA
ncbi:MAG: aminotransferase class III-fold pyridoxal phosphate-dependent enzyme [Nitrososphaeria archaeon]|nr:aminotransferase class III-fold pyridoxal phosphate-dependent enzyme [Nitrososphaeria archaeon]